MARTPDHAFCDQLTSCRAERGDSPIQLVRDVARAMRAGSELRHGPEILFFRRRQTVETNAEEAFVQCSNGGLRGKLDIVQSDWRGLRGLPCMFAPFL